MRSDVCLVLEGTYPFVAGGVSTWVAQILAAMPHLRFSILFIGANREAVRRRKYEVPPNVVEIREVLLHDYDVDEPFRMHERSALRANGWEILRRFLRNVFDGRWSDLRPVLGVLGGVRGENDFLRTVTRSREAWRAMVAHYEATAPSDLSFVDYFWTYRFIVVPLLRLLRCPMPIARVYHTACTGYAGILAARARYTNNAPMIVTEHGLYRRERRIEIFNADWIQEAAPDTSLDLRREQSFFKQWWSRFFLSLSRIAYGAADHVTTLFEANRNEQIRDGADPERTLVIPNGIDTESYGHLQRRHRGRNDPLEIGFVGRVASIKDVKTLLRALAVLRARDVAFRAHILGPLDEEADYVAECRQLTDALDLGETVSYHGRVDVTAFYPQLDAVVLTSLSEGLPFVILEANCAGVPVVATDVGACRDLLLGRTAEDRVLGPSGILTPVASPEATASALERLAASPALSRRMGEAGALRVRRFYELRDVMNSYLELYERHLYAGSYSSCSLERPSLADKAGDEPGAYDSAGRDGEG